MKNIGTTWSVMYNGVDTSYCVGVYDSWHTWSWDPYLHGRRTYMSTSADCGEPETVAQEATHRSTQGTRVQQLQVCTHVYLSPLSLSLSPLCLLFILGICRKYCTNLRLICCKIYLRQMVLANIWDKWIHIKYTWVKSFTETYLRRLWWIQTTHIFDNWI